MKPLAHRESFEPPLFRCKGCWKHSSAIFCPSTDRQTQWEPSVLIHEMPFSPVLPHQKVTQNSRIKITGNNTMARLVLFGRRRKKKIE